MAGAGSSEWLLAVLAKPISALEKLPMLSAEAWVLWLGLGGAVVAGVSLRFWARARYFERPKNALGIPQYRSYVDFIGSRVLEGTANAAGSLLLTLGGALAVLLVGRWWLYG